MTEPAPHRRRKIVQLIYGPANGLMALCNDGSVWMLRDGRHGERRVEWRRMLHRIEGGGWLGMTADEEKEIGL